MSETTPQEPPAAVSTAPRCSLTPGETAILARVDAGERLRWLSGDIIDNTRDPNRRFLFLGREELDDEAELEVVGLAQKGILRQTQDPTNTKLILNIERV